MYQPEQHREDRLDVQHDLIETHPSGLLIPHDREGLQANGLPFLLQRSIGPFGRLQAHIAAPTRSGASSTGRRCWSSSKAR